MQNKDICVHLLIYYLISVILGTIAFWDSMLISYKCQVAYIRVFTAVIKKFKSYQNYIFRILKGEGKCLMCLYVILFTHTKV